MHAIDLIVDGLSMHACMQSFIHNQNTVTLYGKEAYKSVGWMISWLITQKIYCLSPRNGRNTIDNFTISAGITM